MIYRARSELERGSRARARHAYTPIAITLSAWEQKVGNSLAMFHRLIITVRRGRGSPPLHPSANYSYGSPRLINDTANRARYRVPRIISVAVSRGCCIIPRPRATCPRKVSITRRVFFSPISLSLSLSLRKEETTTPRMIDVFSFSRNVFSIIIGECEFTRGNA